MNELTSMLTERWYVLAFLASFVVICWAERGWQRMLVWLISGTFIGWLMEFSSIRNGFPFGHYSYHEYNFPDELFIGGVPLFASLSFAFLTYFGYSAACTLLGRLERRDSDIVRVDDDALAGSLRVLALAAIITTWIDLVIDPVSRLGRYWFLGNVYHYHSHGAHFGVPLTNYAGWLLTALLVVFVNQRAHLLLHSLGTIVRGFHLPMKPFWALGTVIGNFVFMLSVTVYLLGWGDVPEHDSGGMRVVGFLNLIHQQPAPGASVGGILLSGLLLSGAFVLVVTAVLGAKLSRRQPAYRLGQAGAEAN